jgi:hypothetical protein
MEEECRAPRRIGISAASANHDDIPAFTLAHQKRLDIAWTIRAPNGSTQRRSKSNKWTARW